MSPLVILAIVIAVIIIGSFLKLLLFDRLKVRAIFDSLSALGFRPIDVADLAFGKLAAKYFQSPFSPGSGRKEGGGGYQIVQGVSLTSPEATRYLFDLVILSTPGGENTSVPALLAIEKRTLKAGEFFVSRKLPEMVKSLANQRLAATEVLAGLEPEFSRLFTVWAQEAAGFRVPLALQSALLSLVNSFPFNRTRGQLATLNVTSEGFAISSPRITSRQQIDSLLNSLKSVGGALELKNEVKTGSKQEESGTGN